ncbi:lyase family protein [Crossiella sp. CA-258035]|uniref:lyase family protein n=1 Tax=Crossiella sp. CA-258035 TaxID=2981138 RepID=UPI0024BD46A8|nr:lyase family protein [Crossiella sp. CA-258035]WHT15988.1 lyase family protein [Crossiella sp. CA-258035]
MSDLFDGLSAAGPVRAEVGDRAWLRAMLAFERALATAQAEVGLLAPEHAAAIARACDQAVRDPAVGDPAVGDSAARDSVTRDSAVRDPARDPAARDPVARDPAAADPAAGDVAGGDPAQLGPAEIGAAKARPAEIGAVEIDPAEIGAEASGVGNPAAPLVRALTARVGGAASRYVHQGATSQDVLDTAAMLVLRGATRALLSTVDIAGTRAAELAAAHRDTPQAGRTLGQQALPVTFGFTAATWLSALTAARDRLRGLRFAAQLGGAAGTLASLEDSGPTVLAALARELELDEPVLPWHTERSRLTAIAAAFGEVAGAAKGIARTIVLLAQTEVGEVFEEGPPGSGGSSTLPHKRNPVAAVLAAGAAAQAPGLVATVFAVRPQEYQRAAGNWHAEWRPLTELARVTGSAVHWVAESLARLRVDPGRMRANLDRTGGLLLAERVTSALVDEVGRLAAHDAVARCARQAAAEGGFAAVLAADPVVGEHLSAERIAELLDPAGYVGSAGLFVDRALAAWQEEDR